MAFKYSLSLLALVSAALAQNCPLQFDGRMPGGTKPASFDSKSTSLFDPSNVFDLTWSKIITPPPNPTSPLFDHCGQPPISLSLTDSSIFAPSATNIQLGFRRAELLPSSNNGSDASTTGIKTLHFSIQKDLAHPLNFSHEYQLVFLETADFSDNQFVLKTGTILGSNGTAATGDRLVVVGNINDGAKELFSTPWTEGWHNFGVVLDFDRNTTQILHSTALLPLKNVTTPLSNNISGRGQYHFGMLKKPTDTPSGGDITKSGFQEAGIDERVVYGGIFMEKSEGGCVSLS
ncbi:hypothetical protein CJF32_00006233 [Rutstroemia sp. NJR-2017a WRK4]|nr:hypothetical protein CJF32_00006233 [Rutstroemia sp. NJR-2017a WRK4]